MNRRSLFTRLAALIAFAKTAVFADKRASSDVEHTAGPEYWTVTDKAETCANALDSWTQVRCAPVGDDAECCQE